MHTEPSSPPSAAETLRGANANGSLLYGHSLLQHILTTASTVPVPDPDYHVRFGRAGSYDALLSTNYSEIVERSGLLDAAQRHGRVMISGRGGAGKTVTLSHLARNAAEREWPAILVDLKKWSSRDRDQWAHDARSSVVKENRLLRWVVEQFGHPRIKMEQFNALPPDTPKVLLVDGLNEVDGGVAEALLAAVDRFAAEQILAAVIVADRLVRRPIDADRWALFAPIPLGHTRDEGRSGSGLLDLPFFLAASDQNAGDNPSRSDIIERYLFAHAGIAREDLGPLAQAAFDAYERNHSRTFSLNVFRDIAPIGTAKLAEAGVIATQADDASFAHHLLHDFLAGQFVAAHQVLWTRDALRAISFEGSSFDAVSLAFEQIAKTNTTADVAGLCSAFLRTVYDWNPYATAYCLEDTARASEAVVGEELRLIIVAMLAERTRDPVRGTRQRALDALALLNDPRIPADLTSADSVRSLVHAIAGASEEFIRWRSIFLRPDGLGASSEDLNVLMSEDSVLGWTLANVLKRGALTPDQEHRLQGELIENTDPTLRWRAAHVLGAHPSKDGIDALFSALGDPDSLVRYGAARSLIEMVWRDRSLRSLFLSVAAKKAAMLLSDGSVLNAMLHAFDVVDRTPDWTYFAVQFARVFYRQVDDPTAGARWIAFAESMGGADDGDAAD